jgi:hypothetical protein
LIFQKILGFRFRFSIEYNQPAAIPHPAKINVREWKVPKQNFTMTKTKKRGKGKVHHRIGHEGPKGE